LCPLRGHGNVVSSLAFKPDDPNVLVTGSLDKTIKLWDLSTSTCLSTMTVHQRPVSSVHFSPDGMRLVSGSSTSTDVALSLLSLSISTLLSDRHSFIACQ